MRRIAVSKDVVAGAVLLAASIGYYVMSTDLPSSVLDTTIPSSAMPQMLSILGAVLSVALIVSGVTAGRRAAEGRERALPPAAAEIGRADPPAPPKKEIRSDWQAYRRAILFLVIATASVALLDVVGYVLAMVVLIFTVARFQAAFYGQNRPLWRDASVAAGGALIFWLTFVKLLGVSMPLGLWRHVL